MCNENIFVETSLNCPYLVPDRVPPWDPFCPRVGIYFIPAVTNNKSALKNISSVLMNNIPLLMNKVPLSQDLTCKSKKVPVERHFKSFYRLREVTSDLT